MGRTIRENILRIRWTPKLEEDMTLFLAEEKKYAPEELEGIEDFRAEDGKLFWKEYEVISNAEERIKLLKKTYFDEEKPQGMTALIRYMMAHFIGYKSREIQEWVRKQQDYQDSRQVHKVDAVKSFIVPKAPLHTIEVDLMYFSQRKEDLKANSGFHLLFTAIDQFSKYGFCEWITTSNQSETKRVLKKLLAELPRKPEVIASDDGVEFRSKFREFITGQGMKHVRTQGGTPLKHIERFNLGVRRAATMFRTRYDSKRIKGYVKTYVKRYNNTVQARVLATPNQILKMGPEELEKVWLTMMRIANTRHRKKGKAMRQVKKGMYVRVVDEKHAKAREKVKVGQSHTMPGLRWQKTVYKVEQVRKARVRIKMAEGLFKWFPRHYVQLVPQKSDPRKTYSDRPAFKPDERDPERAEKHGDPAVRAAEKAKPMDKRAKALMEKAKKKDAQKQFEKIEKKAKRGRKRGNKNKPQPQNQHSIFDLLRKLK